MEKIFLYPSALFASRKPHQVTTILGSCVAICMWDKKNRIGGINHYMLPLWNGKGLASPKYGNIAVNKLLSKLENLGANKNDIIAKVFGGGEVISTQKSNMNIGERNIAVAKEILKEYKIPIISSSVGGKNGRKIIFYTESGDVMHRFIRNTKNG